MNAIQKMNEKINEKNFFNNKLQFFFGTKFIHSLKWLDSFITYQRKEKKNRNSYWWLIAHISSFSFSFFWLHFSFFFSFAQMFKIRVSSTFFSYFLSSFTLLISFTTDKQTIHLNLYYYRLLSSLSLAIFTQTIFANHQTLLSK